MRRCGSSNARRTAPVTTILSSELAVGTAMRKPRYLETPMLRKGTMSEEQNRGLCLSMPFVACNVGLTMQGEKARTSSRSDSSSEQPCRSFATKPSRVKSHRHSVIAEHVRSYDCSCKGTVNLDLAANSPGTRRMKSSSFWADNCHNCWV
jgi:hypothetical protein